MDTFIAIIWVVFMIIAAISAIAKKAKQQQDMQARKSTGEEAPESKPVYTAPEEDIRSFLEQIGAQPPPVRPQPARPQQPQPVRRPQQARPRPARQTQLPQPQRKEPRRPKPAAKKIPWQDADAQIDSDVPVVPKVTTVADTVTALTGRLSPIQRAVVWREILDPPPGLRAGAFTREA